MRARGMHDLRDVATELYFVKINSVVSSTIMFAAEACATPAPYTKDMAAGSIWLGGVLFGQFLGLLQMFYFSLSKSPLLRYIPLCKFPPLDKIFVALMKGELNNSRHRQRLNSGEYMVERICGVSGHDAIPETPLVIC
jgi:hypothetical protein